MCEQLMRNSNSSSIKAKNLNLKGIAKKFYEREAGNEISFNPTQAITMKSYSYFKSPVIASAIQPKLKVFNKDLEIIKKH